MARLIDADALKKELINLEPRCANKFVQQGLDDGLHYYMPKIIDEQPTIDAVEVVRCEKCKHRLEPTGMCMNPMAVGWDALEPNDDDFCSYGERRDSDG